MGYFCSDTVFNLSNRVLTDIEIKVLEKGLDFAPLQRKLMNQSKDKILQSFVDECALIGFSETNLHHSLVKFLLFLVSPLWSLQKVTPT